jgi:flavin reductase
MERNVAVEKQAYREAMARLGAAVNVITTDGPGGRAGFTASAVCSVTDDPPTLLVCVNLSSRQNDFLRGNGVLCVNTLAAGQSDIARLFSTKDLTMDERFAGGGWSTLATGSPVLEAALTSFDCTVVERLEKGTHAVILCEVQAVRVGEAAEPLVYFGRGYRPILSMGQTD